MAIQFRSGAASPAQAYVRSFFAAAAPRFRQQKGMQERHAVHSAQPHAKHHQRPLQNCVATWAASSSVSFDSSIDLSFQYRRPPSLLHVTSLISMVVTPFVELKDGIPGGNGMLAMRDV